MCKKVLITGNKMAREAMELLASNNIQVLLAGSYASEERLVALAKEHQVDAIIVRTGRITEKVLAASPKLKVVTKHGVGVDNIDIAAATKLKIPIMITPNANHLSVAEHAVGLMFALAKNTLYVDARIRQGYWDKVVYNGKELWEKNVGLIGFGRIGRDVVDILQPLNMKVRVYDPYVSENDLPESVTKVHCLEEVLSWADFISIHCPLTPDTKRLVGINELKLMKDTAFIINTARGGIIDEAALVTALEMGLIAGAALDTFTIEPPAKDNPLLVMKNVIVTPHIGGATKEALTRMGLEAVQNALQILSGQQPDSASIVNPEVFRI